MVSGQLCCACRLFNPALNSPFRQPPGNIDDGVRRGPGPSGPAQFPEIRQPAATAIEDLQLLLKGEILKDE